MSVVLAQFRGLRPEVARTERSVTLRIDHLRVNFISGAVCYGTVEVDLLTSGADATSGEFRIGFPVNYGMICHARA